MAQIPGDFKIYLLAGGSFRTVKSESLENLVNSYNEGWSNSLSSPIRKFDPMVGYGAGLGIRLFIFSVELKRYGYFSQTRAFTFRNGDRREMELKLRGWDINIPVVVPISNSVALGVDFQLNVENGELHSRMSYDDGTTSYGNESPMNGIFNFNQCKSLFVGPRLELGTRVRAQLSVMWGLGDLNSKDVAGIQDLSSIYGSSWANGANTVYLVSDFAQRNNSDYYHLGVNSESLVQRHVKGLKVEFTVAVDLFNKTLIRELK
jgi:hypothetical protein